MPAPEFNERQYEFCANYQLQSALGAYLVGGMPAIPSQLEEALLGYDAAYSFASGRTLFVQYKIAHFAQKAWGRGATTYRLWGVPYFRAQLHQDRYGRYTQHNTLVGLGSTSNHVFYVSPCFHERRELLAQFGAGAGTGVLDNSLLAPLAGVPSIHDADAHSITYPEDGTAFRLHSETSGPYAALPTVEAALTAAEEERWGVDYFASLRDQVRDLLQRQDLPPAEAPGDRGFDGPLAELAAMLDQRVGAVMALVPSPSRGRSITAF